MLNPRFLQPNQPEKSEHDSSAAHGFFSLIYGRSADTASPRPSIGLFVGRLLNSIPRALGNHLRAALLVLSVVVVIGLIDALFPVAGIQDEMRRQYPAGAWWCVGLASECDSRYGCTHARTYMVLTGVSVLPAIVGAVQSEGSSWASGDLLTTCQTLLYYGVFYAWAYGWLRERAERQRDGKLP